MNTDSHYPSDLRDEEGLLPIPMLIGLLAILALLLSGCSVGPDYKRADLGPEVQTPAAFTEGAAPAKEAAPADALAKGTWWTVFNDPALNDLEAQAAASNQNLKAAVSRVDQARALTKVAKSQLLPTVDFNPSGSIYRLPDNKSTTAPGLQSNVATAQGDLNYEVDLWGRVRRSIEASTASYQASVADFESVRLALHAEVAQDYFTLRAADGEIAILESAIDLRRQSLDLIKARFQAGASNDLDVARAETEYATAKAALFAVRQNRAELEHGLAVLTGKSVESFKLAAAPLDKLGLPPAIPTGVPSELLERRPDVAEAERQMAAANAQVGVAKAAFFPTVKLTGAAGFQSVDLGSLVNWSSRMWSVGPSLSLPIFEGGRNTANLNRAHAAYDETVALYRQQVLTSFKEVEDSLSGLRNLSGQAEAEASAVTASQRSSTLSDLRYRNGSATYLDVIDSERSALDTQRAAIQTLGQRYVASVRLIKALGGGWSESALATTPATASTTPSEPSSNPASTTVAQADR
ncbi:outer membrane protein, multidrug efflux system [Verrucomicrobium sp. GAS474]|uniref:efflux transporter outer membrane subunit n=1 Tax=Verrucomicrobium sp. GAS474 TaxID=1882831 RepID=UPI00087C7C1B|nr:efflux transporter outer membrane subunit [Verrucomicrobium sp. GAS474]SDT92335.1 outer membrane protein, multidrug efflux system [Verrucomicrobium sp. GAS474]